MMYIKLDLQYFAGEKTEKATPKKKQDARKKGQVAKSADVNTALVLFLVFALLWVTGGQMLEVFLSFFRQSFQEYIVFSLSEANIHTIFVELSVEAAYLLAPIMVVAMIAGVAANYMQIGFLFSTETIKLSLNKINPISGAKRIFSTRAIVELLKSILKISLVGTVTFAILWFRMDEVMFLSQKTVLEAGAFLGQTAVLMGAVASLFLLFLSILDYLYQKYDHEKQLRMSKQDIKDEHKNIEGDPLIKGKIKEKQRQMAMQRMMQEVPDADVVITNPTHYSIALKYDENKVQAPIVVAKGVDYVALKIREIAEKHQVVMVENKPLARALYAQAEIGDAIPEDFFKAVAEILAYVYRLKQKT